MLPEQRPFAIITSLILLALIVYLIRKRKLREEYALLWLLVGVAVIVLSIWYSLIQWITRFIGAVDPTSTLFIFSLLFLLILSIHFSVAHSRMADQIKDLTQEIAMLRHEMERQKGEAMESGEDKEEKNSKT